MFTVDTKTQSPRFQIPSFEERFQKAPFSRRINMDGRPICGVVSQRYT